MISIHVEFALFKYNSYISSYSFQQYLKLINNSKKECHYPTLFWPLKWPRKYWFDEIQIKYYQ